MTYTRDSVINLLAALPNSKRKSITPDRGKEFSKHREVTQYLDNIPFYFADSHAHGKEEQMKIQMDY